MNILEYFTVDNMVEAKRNIKIGIYFVVIPCAVWWVNTVYKVIGFLFGSRD